VGCDKEIFSFDISIHVVPTQYRRETSSLNEQKGEQIGEQNSNLTFYIGEIK